MSGSNPNHEKAKEFAINLVIGGAANAIFSLVPAPLERVRLLWQLQSSSNQIVAGQRYSGIIDIFRRIPSEQGVLSFWRGNMPHVIRLFPTQLLNFAFKDTYNNLLPKYNPGTDFGKFFSVNMLAGGLAGATALLFVYPLDLARTRLALDVGKGDSRMFTGFTQCLMSVYKKNGICGLYQGYGVSVIGVMAYRALFFGGYDTLKQAVFKDNTQPSFLSAWLVAQAVTIGSGFLVYPFDTIRGHLMMQSGRSEKVYRHTFDCICSLYNEAGVKAFFRGYSCRLVTGVFGPILLVMYDQLFHQKV